MKIGVLPAMSGDRRLQLLIIVIQINIFIVTKNAKRGFQFNLTQDASPFLRSAVKISVEI